MKYKLPFIQNRTELIAEKFCLDNSSKYVWGMKKSGERVRNNSFYLKKNKIIFLEDGFINSFGLKKKKIPLSICIDENGIYYDYKCKSKINNFINSQLEGDEFLRAQNIINLWKKNSISKYNYPNFIHPPQEPYVLLIDQTKGDLSIQFGGASIKNFEIMLNFAINKWPKHKIVIKKHPDTINSNKKGCIDNYLNNKKIIIIREKGQINDLIKLSSAVCVVTSQVGFESLIYGKEVHVFGMPFYSGLGLTHDHNDFSCKKNNHKVTLEQLVFGSLIKYQKYLDPRNNSICEIEKVIEYIAQKRRLSNLIPQFCHALDLTPWKARQVNRFVLEGSRDKASFWKKFNNNMKNIMVWGKSQKSDKFKSEVSEFISIEDGFIRSVGLGGDLYSPLSLLFDKKGIHYDGSKVSDLEDLLQNYKVNNSEKIRARKLINLLIKLKISKYNLRLNKEIKLPNNINKQIIAVLGQVETDNSIIYGVPNNTIQKTNFALVEKVRNDYPDAYIIYKPHPDTESGLRAKGNKEAYIYNNADLIARRTSLEDLFNKVDRVAVFTSLAGFEALIRGVSVTTYGLPFYAGWGLTEDKLNNHIWSKRRTRKLTIEELTFIALVKYPFYASVKFNCLTEVENIIDEIVSSNMKKNLEQIIFKYWGFLKDYFLKISK